MSQSIGEILDVVLAAHDNCDQIFVRQVHESLIRQEIFLVDSLCRFIPFEEISKLDKCLRFLLLDSLSVHAAN